MIFTNPMQNTYNTILGGFNPRPIQPAANPILAALMATHTSPPAQTAPGCDGLELEMFSVGKADSILVTTWAAGAPSYILIDGGNSGNSNDVLKMLAGRKVTVLDHVVCSHPHNDHSAGLIGIIQSEALTIRNFWMHDPAEHVDVARMRETLSKAQQREVSRVVLGSLENTSALRAAVQKRKSIIVHRPFAGKSIGPLYVCGPSVEFYTSLLAEFTDFEKIKAFDESLAAYQSQLSQEASGARTEKFGDPSDSSDDTLGGGRTEPENDSSVILWAKCDEKQFLFTADAGVLALEDVAKRNKLEGIHWMQIPHHGSRRNLTEALIKTYRPYYAFVSADGSSKHPRKKVVDAFKALNTKVFSTHHPKSTNLHYGVGKVPARGYSPATPL